MSWGNGQQVNNGRYQIVDRIGTGGFGVTYKAIDLKAPAPHPIVAIKTLNEKRQRQANFDRLQENFLNEALALAKCSHPHVIRVDRVFQEDGIWAMVMEYIEGESLEDYLIEHGRLPETQAVEILQKVGSAVNYVHAQQLLHRDIKPANILLRPNGEPVLIDFGLAREFMVGIARSMTSDRTPHYSPPEQAERRGDFQPSLDIYALAATLYTCVTGDLPPLAEVRIAHDSLIPPQQVNPQLSDRVNQAILTGMALQPADRSRTVEEWLGLMVEEPNRSGQPESQQPKSNSSDQNNRSRSTQPVCSFFTFETAHVEIMTKTSRGLLGLNEKQENTPRITIISGQAEYYTETLGNGVALDLVCIAAGSFTMGSPASEKESSDREKPQHLVNIPAFYIGKYPITQAQYQAIMGDNPSKFKGNNRPVESVSWEQAKEFCTKLSTQTGKTYGLPSESQWEYACRAGTTTPFCFGEVITTDIANYDGNFTYGDAPKGLSRKETSDVGKFPSNAFGLYDMHANVWEWCEDTWHENYQGAPTDGSAWVSVNDRDKRLLRGGAWDYFPWTCRSAFRIWWSADNRYCNVGFRVIHLPSVRIIDHLPLQVVNDIS